MKYLIKLMGYGIFLVWAFPAFGSSWCASAFHEEVAEALQSEQLSQRLSHPMLSIEQEKALHEQLIQARQQGDHETINIIATILIGANQKLLYVKLAKRFRYEDFGPVERLDLLNQCLYVAFEKFSPERGFRFATFGYRVAYNHMLHLIRKSQKSEREKSNFTVTNSDGEDVYLVDMLPARNEGSEIESRQEEKEESQAAVASFYIRMLTEPEAFGLTLKQAQILQWRFPIDGRKPLTLQEIADQLTPKTSREAVRQAQDRGLTNLRKYLTSQASSS